MPSRAAFTFIEIIVTIGILVLLTSVLLLYNRGGERQIVLLQEKARLIDVLLKAKSDSINTLITDEPICGYGVHFETTGYTLFADHASDCQTSDLIYTDTNPDELVQTVTLPATLSFTQLSVRDVLFLPPTPLALFDGRFGADEITIGMSASGDTQSSVNIHLNNAGQISE